MKITEYGNVIINGKPDDIGFDGFEFDLDESIGTLKSKGLWK